MAGEVGIPTEEMDRQTAEMGKPRGAALETQMGAIDERQEAAVGSVEAGLELDIAREQLRGLNTSERVGQLAASVLSKIGSLAETRAGSLEGKATAAKDAKEFHQQNIVGIADKWASVTASETKTDVLGRLAHDIDPNVRVVRGSWPSRQVESARRLVDRLPTWYHEARTRVNARKESRRASKAEKYSFTADKLRGYAQDFKDGLSSLNRNQGKRSGRALGKAQGGVETAGDRTEVAQQRLETAVSDVYQTGEQGRSAVGLEKPGDTVAQEATVGKATDQMVESMQSASTQGVK